MVFPFGIEKSKVARSGETILVSGQKLLAHATTQKIPKRELGEYSGEWGVCFWMLCIIVITTSLLFAFSSSLREYYNAISGWAIFRCYIH